MTKYILDAYAWVEYFDGTLLGSKVEEVINNQKNESFTSLITIAELASFFTRKGHEFKPAKESILSLSKILVLDVEMCQEAGILHAELKKTRKHLSLADAFVVAGARHIKAKILTGDEDFRGLREVEMLK